MLSLVIIMAIAATRLAKEMIIVMSCVYVEDGFTQLSRPQSSKHSFKT